MKGVSYITDEKSRKKAVVIDLKTLEKYEEQIEDLFDIIIAESRRDETFYKLGIKTPEEKREAVRCMLFGLTSLQKRNLKVAYSDDQENQQSNRCINRQSTTNRIKENRGSKGIFVVNTSW